MCQCNCCLFSQLANSWHRAAVQRSTWKRNDLVLLIQGEASTPEGLAVVQALQVCDVVLPGALLQRPVGCTAGVENDAQLPDTLAPIIQTAYRHHGPQPSINASSVSHRYSRTCPVCANVTRAFTTVSLQMQSAGCLCKRDLLHGYADDWLSC